jgi:anti-sigma regulatory factor (Ser/Thr protein kinase)
VSLDLELELASSIDAAAEARRALDRVGDELPGPRMRDVRLLVSELVTNAVRHAGLGPEDLIVLHLAAADGVVRAEVYDPGPGFVPVVREPGPEGGFGLVLLRTLSDRWGVSTGGWTCVWFELDR